jgi:hypothetical protein
MATAVIELNDIELRCGRGDNVIASPGYALLTRAGVLTGADARARAWLEPHHSFDQYWQQLGLSALGGKNPHARHFADLAYAQLLALHRAAGEPGRVVFAVPGSFSRDQLAVLLGIARATPFTVTGLVDAAVAAATQQSTPGALLHLDLQRHGAILTAVSGGDELRRQRVTLLPELGLKAFHSLWAQFIAERFIATYRYDPLHTGAGEQALHDALPGWLATLAREPELAVTLTGPRGPLRLQLAAAELAQAARELYGRLTTAIQEARAVTNAPTPDALLLSHHFATLPGSGTRLAGVVLAPHAAVTGCLSRTETFATQAANILLTALPATVDKAPAPASAGVSTRSAPATARPRASHLLFRHRAYPLGAGLLIEAAGNGLQLRAAVAGEPLLPDTLLFGSRGGALTVAGSLAGAELSGDPADLRVGDRLRIGIELLELIEVA